MDGNKPPRQYVGTSYFVQNLIEPVVCKVAVRIHSVGSRSC
jgi:hypothetical protein